jgi:hypothetical protein
MCRGHPYATVPWPHRELHEAADLIDRMLAALRSAASDNPDWELITSAIDEAEGASASERTKP